MAKADVSKPPLSGEDIQRFLRSFEGAASTFALDEDAWTLWLPEIAASDHPLTPSSQIFFPVILRHGPQAIAIRFLYDCSLGKVRYYTSAIPSELTSAPGFENAVSELFRHSLPVEPVRERKLGRLSHENLRKAERAELPRAAVGKSLAEPDEVPTPKNLVTIQSSPVPPVRTMTVVEQAISEPAPLLSEIETKRTMRIEIGPRVRSVLVVFIIAVSLVILVMVSLYAYLQATEDPGVLHHRLQVEEMRLREGR